MSNADSFIDEVTEEVRRDRLFAMMRRYGWIAVLLILALVAGTAWREYSKASAERSAQELGDAILTALERSDAGPRAVALQDLTASDPKSQAVLQLLQLAALSASGQTAEAAAVVEGLATSQDVPAIYRDLGAFKALLAGAGSMDPATRRAGLETLTAPGNPMRVLAEEQLALMDLSDGNRQQALDRLTALVVDAEATAGLRQRATQVIVALGGDLPDLTTLLGAAAAATE